MRVVQTIAAVVLAGMLGGCGTSGQTLIEKDVPRDEGGGPADAGSDADAGPDLVELATETELPAGDEVAPPDVPECEPGNGCFLDPCEGSKDCQSGWCMLHLGAKVCSQECVEECPAGFVCAQVMQALPDVLFACMSRFPTLCLPCKSDAECKEQGGLASACIQYGGQGGFCGTACALDQDCPDGFACEQAATVEGLLTAQCAALAGSCPCTKYAVDNELATGCSVSTQFGTCMGERKCTGDGLTECSAAVPAEEVCDGEDNDCSGEVDDVSCEDGNPCTADECLAAAGCQHTPMTGGECLDGDACTVGDHCADGVCTGSPLECDDKNPCTAEWCDSALGCQEEYLDAGCDDLNPCTFGDSCLAGDCVGLPGYCECTGNADCDAVQAENPCLGDWYCDKSATPYHCVVVPGSEVTCQPPAGGDQDCYQNQCDPATGECAVVPVSQGKACEDGDPCTYGEQCNQAKCLGGVAVNCNDGNPCTDDLCQGGVGCFHLENVQPCSDSDACTAGDHCEKGKCVAGAAVECSDGNPCTDDLCDQVKGCLHPANKAACDDGNVCTGGDHCSSGWCVASAPTDCNDDNPCTQDSCDAKVGCKYALSTDACDDGDPCTVGDACKLGACVPGKPVVCDDANPCTTDSCGVGGGCLFAPVAGACDDGNPCTKGDHCLLGKCAADSILDCDDSNPCTKDFCDPKSGCAHSMLAIACEDGSVCTAGDKCAAGTCQPGKTIACEDGNACTDDSCDPAAGCVHGPNQAGCSDGNACTEGDKCGGGQCIAGKPLACDDGNACTDDSCDKVAGCLHANNTAACDDGNLCTTNDKCAAGGCVPGAALTCNDGNACTQDACVPNQGCVYTSTVPCCGNGVKEAGEDCDDSNTVNGDGCSSACKTEAGACFTNWLVGTPCNGVNYGNGCVPSDTGYHFVGIYSGYACFWHHKNQAWNTSTDSNFYHLALHFGVTPGVGKCHWCDNKFSQPNPTGYDSCSGYFSASNVGAWGWCAEGDPNSVGFVCIPAEGHPAC